MVRRGLILLGLLALAALVVFRLTSSPETPEKKPDPPGVPEEMPSLSIPEDEPPPIGFDDDPDDPEDGGIENLRAETGGVTLGPVERALLWLQRNQDRDGSWGGSHGDTALALLAFVAVGNTHRTGPDRECIRRGFVFLKSIQDDDGCFGPRANPNCVRDHIRSALAMAEIYALTGSPLFKQSVQRGVDFLLTVRVRGGGWPVVVGSSDADVGITIWAILALESARTGGGLRTSVVARDEALVWLDGQTSESGLVGEGSAADRWLTAGVCAARVIGGEPCRPATGKLAKSLALCGSRLPRWNEDGSPGDLRRCCLGSMAMRRVGGESWRAWYDARRKAIIRAGPRKHADAGPRESARAPGENGGRVYSTAMTVMCHAAYFGYQTFR